MAAQEKAQEARISADGCTESEIEAIRQAAINLADKIYEFDERLLRYGRWIWSDARTMEKTAREGGVIDTISLSAADAKNYLYHIYSTAKHLYNQAEKLENETIRMIKAGSGCRNIGAIG